MTGKKPTTLILGNALAWAAAILGTAYFTRGTVDKDTSFMITLFLITGWFTVNGLLTARSGATRKGLACIKKRYW